MFSNKIKKRKKTNKSPYFEQKVEYKGGVRGNTFQHLYAKINSFLKDDEFFVKMLYLYENMKIGGISDEKMNKIHFVLLSTCTIFVVSKKEIY